MTAGPEFDERTGRLLLAEATFDALVAHATKAGEEPAAPEVRNAGNPVEEEDEELQSLRATGALDSQGRPHDALAGALAAIRKAVGTVELSYKNDVMRGWIGEFGVALLAPVVGDPDRRQLSDVPPSALPGVLAKAADLGPRPRPDYAGAIPYGDAVLANTRRHWRLSVTWAWGGGSCLPAQGASEATAFEVIDTDDGMWLVEHNEDGGDSLAWPTTPTTVTRKIVRHTSPR